MARRVLLALLLGVAGGLILPAPGVHGADAAVETEPGAAPVITSEAVKSKRKSGKRKPASPAAVAPAPEETAPEAESFAEPPGSKPVKAKKARRKPAMRAGKKAAAKPPEPAAPGPETPVENPFGPAATPAIAKKPAPEEPDETARLTAVKGFVEILSAGRKDWREVSGGGEEFKRGDRLQTYADAGVTAEFHEGSKVEMSPFSILSIEKDKFDHIAVGLFQGKVSAKVSWRARRKFEVRAPGAAVVAKADEKFSVSATSDRRVKVSVEAGEVLVYAVGAKKKLKARESVEVSGGRMGPVELFGPAFTAPPEEAPEAEREEPVETPGGGEEVGAAPKAAVSDGPRQRAALAGDFRAEAEREVHRSLSRDALESASVFEVRASQYQEGHVLVDATGGRVRVEEYLTRPDPKSFKVITLNSREGRLDYGTLQVEANMVLPTELDAAGDLFYSPSAAKPAYWAVKYLWTQSNSVDTVTRVGVDGDALAVTLVPGPVYDPAAGRYDAPAVKPAYQTLFGNAYEFVNGASEGIQRVYTDPTFRPADNGTTAGTLVSGMFARLQPIEVRVRDVAVPGTVLATYYEYSFLSLNPADGSGNATGKAEVVGFTAPDASRSRFLERKWFVNFRDTNGNGILDFAEDTEAGAGCRYGNCAAANVFHDKVSRLNGTATVALPGAGCQGVDAACLDNTGDTHFFSDADNDGVVDAGEAAVVGVTGAADAALLAFAAASPRAWLEEDRVTLDDRGRAAEALTQSAGGSTKGYNVVADLYGKGVFERRVSGSMFIGGKLDLVLVPSLHLAAGLVKGEASGARAPAAGGGGLVW
ncbi:MAG: FecR domain-containing protein [Elusimicrobia bacterium]|nr:FecR domain-containing protein [Elusimicrobiota bacterium]